jgi:hypothetical protein
MLLYLCVNCCQGFMRGFGRGSSMWQDFKNMAGCGDLNQNWANGG